MEFRGCDKMDVSKIRYELIKQKESNFKVANWYTPIITARQWTYGIIAVI